MQFTRNGTVPLSDTDLGTGATALLPNDLFINGQWIEGAGDVVDVINPATEEPIRSMHSASLEQVDSAISAARAAFSDGPWSRSSPHSRRDLLVQLADLVESHRSELEEIVVADVGTPISLARTLQVGVPINNLRWFAEAAVRGPRGGLEEAMPLHIGNVTSSSVLFREPAGVVAALVAYNYPIYLTVWKLGAALAAGCTVVLMPSPRGALAVAAFVELVRQAGYPDGVVNFVQGPPAVGDRLARHPAVDMVSFTGSPTAGAAIMAAAAETSKKVILELGGKSPDIVLSGVEPSDIMPAAVFRFTRNAGQGCGATTRLVVPRGRYEDFVHATVESLHALRVGDPRQPDTDVGPLITGEHREYVFNKIRQAAHAGADVLCGGDAPARRGFYMNPTLIGGVGNDNDIAQDELFAPVSVIIPYDDVDHAVRLANESRFGLNANVWGDTSEAMAVARRLRVGNVTLNGGGDLRPESPWGGYRQSGVGREMGEDGFAEYFETKHVQWKVR